MSQGKEPESVYKSKESSDTTKGHVVRQAHNTSKLFADVTAAFSEGMKAFGEAIDEENVTRADMSNGFIRAGALSSSKVFERLSVAFKESYERMAAEPAKAAEAPAIDYDLLAQKVAEKMKGGKS